MRDWNLTFQKVISLGPSCETTYHIREIIDQEEAYIFDWVIARPDQVAKAIESNFADFIRPEGLSYNSGEEAGHPYIDDATLGIEFHHDFRNDFNFMDTFEDVNSKYAFLIKRFRDVCERDLAILFVQQHASEAEARALDAAIHAQFPALAFRLLVLSFSQVWAGKGRIRSATISYEGRTWQERTPAWRELLTDVLEPSLSSGSLTLKPQVAATALP